MLLLWNNGTCILPEICRFWVQNVKLGQICPSILTGLKKPSWSQNMESLALAFDLLVPKVPGPLELSPLGIQFDSGYESLLFLHGPSP